MHVTVLKVTVTLTDAALSFIRQANGIGWWVNTT